MAVKDNLNSALGGVKLNAGVGQDTSGYRGFTPYSAIVTGGSGKCTITAQAGGAANNPAAITITIGSKTVSAPAGSQAKLTDVPVKKGDRISVTVNGSSNYFTVLQSCNISYS